MTHITLQNPAAPKDAGIIKFTMLLGGVVFLLMMVFGLIMRAAQGGLIDLDPTLFYQLLTAHGAGMVGSAALSGAAILWYFASRHINLRTAIYILFLGLFLLGVVLILGSIFIGGYGGAWTFLYPLPAVSGGAWEAADTSVQESPPAAVEAQATESKVDPVIIALGLFLLAGVLTANTVANDISGALIP